jgi:hypothetical protein
MVLGLLKTLPVGSIPITPIVSEAFSAWVETQARPVRAWIEAAGFTAQPLQGVQPSRALQAASLAGCKPRSACASLRFQGE